MGKLLMENKHPTEIKTHETFENLFPIREELLKKIEENMTKRQYDYSQPVILATWEGQEEPVVIDGHTRLQAAINMGIDQIPVFTHELDTEEEALELAIHLQRNRRNMTDAEFFACVEALDRIRDRGGDRRSEQAKSTPQHCGNGGRSASAKEMAQMLGCSPRKVEQARTVKKHADEETLKAVKSGEMSVNKGYQETQKKRKGAGTAKKEDQVNKAEESSPKAPEQPELSAVEANPDHQEPAREIETTVRLTKEHYEALCDLGGLIEDHVAAAVETYLESLDDDQNEDDEESDEDDTSEHDDQEWDDDWDDPFGDIDD
jgi:hypothetical protein